MVADPSDAMTCGRVLRALTRQTAAESAVRSCSIPTAGAPKKKAVVSIVMSLPTTGPMLLDALRSQDMFLAGSFLMFMAFLTVIGVFLSDLALAALDPRIRLHVGRQQ